MSDVANQFAPALLVTAVATANRRATVLSRLFPALKHRIPDGSFDVFRDAESDADANGILAELERV